MTDRVDRVLPDVSALDRTFDYLVPGELAGVVEMGTIVRVPLHGRRVRGWVVACDVTPEAAPDRLLPILGAVSAGPPPALVELSAFGAWRWAGPRRAFLRSASPPNVVAPGAPPEPDVAVFPVPEPPVALPDTPVRLLVWPPRVPRTEVVLAMAEPEGSTIVIVPDPVEAASLAAALVDTGRHVVALRGDLAGAARTQAWQDARRGACVVLGGRVATLAPVPDLRGVVILDDADEALVEERAPSWHARELAVERARRSGARASIVTPAPTVEAIELCSGATVVAPRSARARGWTRVRVVDLRDEPPGRALLSSAIGPALHRALDAGGRSLCVLNRRGRATLLLCRACGAIARCQRCEARLREEPGGLRCDQCGDDHALQCTQCGAGVFSKLRPGVTGLRDSIAGLVPRARVVAVDSSSAPLPAFDVAVGTEALLHRVGDVAIGLVAFLDFDQELCAPRFRAFEQALWLLVRAARVTAAVPDAEILVQTRLVEHEVIRAAVSGDVLAVAHAEAARRRTLGFPPFGGLAELRGEPAAIAAACEALAERLTVVGPVDGRALVQATSTSDLCDVLATTDLAPARARGRLRVEVDPTRV